MYKKYNLQAKKSLLSNERGFALAETIAATAILTFALVSIMMMIQYARVRAIVNYHDRYVLLRTDGELQKIKYQHFVHNNFGLLNPVIFTIPHNNHKDRVQKIPVTIRFEVKYEYDESVALDVAFNSVNAIAEWHEFKPLFSQKPIRSENRFVQLREDFYMIRSNQ